MSVPQDTSGRRPSDTTAQQMAVLMQQPQPTMDYSNSAAAAAASATSVAPSTMMVMQPPQQAQPMMMMPEPQPAYIDPVSQMQTVQAEQPQQQLPPPPQQQQVYNADTVEYVQQQAIPDSYVQPDGQYMVVTSVPPPSIPCSEPQYAQAPIDQLAEPNTEDTGVSPSPQPTVDSNVEYEAGENCLEDESSTQGKDVSDVESLALQQTKRATHPLTFVVMPSSMYSSTSSLSSTFSCDHILHANSNQLHHIIAPKEVLRKSSVPNNEQNVHAENLLRRGSLPMSLSEFGNQRLNSRRSSSGAINAPLATLRENRGDSDISLEDLSQVEPILHPDLGQAFWRFFFGQWARTLHSGSSRSSAVVRTIPLIIARLRLLVKLTLSFLVPERAMVLVANSFFQFLFNFLSISCISDIAFIP